MGKGMAKPLRALLKALRQKSKQHQIPHLKQESQRDLLHLINEIFYF